MCFELTSTTRRYANVNGRFYKSFLLHLQNRWNRIAFTIDSTHMQYQYVSGTFGNSLLSNNDLILSPKVIKLKANEDGNITEGYHFNMFQGIPALIDIESVVRKLLRNSTVTIAITATIITTHQVAINVDQGVGVCGSFRTGFELIDPIFTINGEMKSQHLSDILNDIWREYIKIMKETDERSKNNDPK